VRLGACVVAAALLAACGGAPERHAGGPPPMGVAVVTLEPRPIERATEYMGTVRSRRSTTIQPEVEGFVRRIVVRSGDRVGAGDLLLEVDSDRQRAAVASLESVRAAREADLEWARQEADRQRRLSEAGAASQREYELALASLHSAEAQLRAVEERVREARVELDYYRVTAPAGGIVGDVPVRVGDRVSPSTVLTTIDANQALEVYVYVPLRQAGELRLGLPLKLVDEAGAAIARTEIGFVSPQVDEGTQSILVKAPLAEDRGFRTEQLVRVRLVWREEPGLTVPVTAVSRINGAYFAFVAEDAEGRTVARQRALRLGPIVGNDYVLLEGLAPGERLIVSGVQKIGDGAPVSVQAQDRTPEPAAG
jgi:RND family efflux transporter MFP subunit